MKQNRTQYSILHILMILVPAIAVSCKTVPVNTVSAYYLPQNGDRTLYLDGEVADRFLRPMADSLDMDDYSKIEPILEETDRIYLVTAGDGLYIQGQGDYNSGFISFVLGANRDWKKEKIGPFKTYRSESTSLQIAFPDDRTFLLSQGNLSELLDAYYAGGTQDYPFTAARESEEALLIRVSLKEGNVIPMQDLLKTTFHSVEMALSPEGEEALLMDVELWGEEKSGRLLGTALKLFLLASVGRDVMKASMETGDDFALISDIPVDFEFLMNMIGI